MIKEHHEHDTQEKIDQKIENKNEVFIRENSKLINQVEEIYNGFDNQEFQYEKCQHINRYAANVFTLILTANEMERRTLFYYFSKKKRATILQIPCDGIIYSFFSINGINVAHVEPETIGSFTENGMVPTLKKALKRIKPTVVITLGVAFGVNYIEDQIGDVIIGRQLFSYDKATKIKKNSLKIKKLHVLESDGSLLYKLKSRIQMERKITGHLNNKFQAILGNMLTGEYVVDSSTFRQIIISPFAPFGVVGGEMEGFGFFNVLKENKHAHGILIKGICDWGAGKNDDVHDPDAIADCSTKDYKNIFQVLAMLNVCTVCDQFLVNEKFFSDYKIKGCKKRFWRLIGEIKRKFKGMR